MSGGGRMVRAVGLLDGAGREEDSIAGICGAITRAVRLVAPFDVCTLLPVDPETLLPSGGIIQGLRFEDCAAAWDNELLDPDVNKYADLAAGSDPVATLHQAVAGELTLSARYRKMFAPAGVADEMRVAFMWGQRCLAVGAFMRSVASEPFNDAELAAVRQLVPHASRALRQVLARLGVTNADLPSAVLVLDAEGALTAATPRGRDIMERLRMPPDEGPLPTIVQAAVTKARSNGATEIHTRVRDRDGGWLCVHVTPLQGQTEAVAILLDRATPGDLIPLVLDSYGLTPREREVALLLAQGQTVAQLAADLFLSVHTVRDHTKAVYAKLGVTSRGELVSRLFTEQLVVHRAVTEPDLRSVAP